MKKSCPKCNKKFNYDDNMGLCPRCGKYVSLYASKDNIAPKDAPLPVYTSSHKKSSVLKQKRYPTTLVVATLIVATMIIVVPIVVTFCGNKKIMKIEKAQRVEELKEVKKHALQPFAANMGDVDIEVTIENATPFEFEGVQAAEGWKYIEVRYKMDAATYLNGYQYMEVFLHWGGHYVEGLSVNDISNDWLIQDALYNDNIISIDLEEGTGQWVFLVPQELKEATIELYEKQDIPGTEYKKLSNVYLVDIKVED